MLSPKARAFSVDQLLSRRELQEKSEVADDNGKEDERSRRQNEEVCMSFGDEGTCRHQQAVEVIDAGCDVIKVELCQSELWQAFHALGTEMIITKTGRRMFPAVRIRVSGLKPSCKYKVTMDFIPVDKNKYRYVYHSSRWMVAGHGDMLKENQKYEHPESPMTGEYLTSQVMSFEKIKLTNNDAPTTGQVSLLSMQKFQPRIRIEEKNATSGGVTVTFPQTAFIAVTAYQNQEITRLKIARNPFAKGFREAGKCRSSLEAMMASFGVVIDGSVPQRPVATKRKVTDNENDKHPSAKQPFTWPLSGKMMDKRLTVPLPMNVYSSLSSGYQTNIFTNQQSVIKHHSSSKGYHNQPSEISTSFCSNSASMEPMSSKTVSSDYSRILHPASVQSHQNDVQFCLPTPEVHPAFSLYPYSPFPALIDQNYLAAYSKALPTPCLSSLVVVPSNVIPEKITSLKDSSGDLGPRSQAYETMEAINLCTS